MFPRSVVLREVDSPPDVEPALRLGCISVSVGVNYEPSEEEKRDQAEYSRQEDQEANAGDPIFGDIPS